MRYASPAARSCGRGRPRATSIPTTAVSNGFEMEWPPRSGTMQTFPELDRVAWFDVPTGVVKIVSAQRDLLDRLVTMLPTSVEI